MKHKHSTAAFSLVEVVLAIGVVAFAIVAIIGLIPAGLSANHSSQGETRATQIAQDIFAALENQARPLFSPTAPPLNTSAYINQQPTVPQPTASPSPFIQSVNLNGGTFTWSADSDGNLKTYQANLPYKVTVTITPNPATSPAPFNPGYACTVAVRVAWQPVTQNYRDFTRVITRY